MQILFYTDKEAIDFSIMDNEIFPITPERCPFKDCSMPVQLKNTDITNVFLLVRSSLVFYTYEDIFVLYAVEQFRFYRIFVFHIFSIQL